MQQRQPRASLIPRVALRQFDEKRVSLGPQRVVLLAEKTRQGDKVQMQLKVVLSAA